MASSLPELEPVVPGRRPLRLRSTPSGRTGSGRWSRSIRSTPGRSRRSAPPGTLKHENAALASRGRSSRRSTPVTRGQYFYKYVSAVPGWRSAAQRSARSTRACSTWPARRGRLGSWLPRPPHRPASRLADILIHTRTGARRRGDPMDRPSGWPSTRRRRVRLRNLHQQHRPNCGRAGNPVPQPLRSHPPLAEPRRRPRPTAFAWSVFALAGSGLGTGDGRRRRGHLRFARRSRLRRRRAAAGSRPTGELGARTTRCWPPIW